MVNQDHTITLSDSDLDVLSSALVELPYKVCAPLIAKLRAQLDSERNQAQELQEVRASEPMTE